MKTYFTKYLPVEGEIKEGDNAFLLEDCDFEQSSGKTGIIKTDDTLKFLFKNNTGYIFCLKKLHGTGESAITLQEGEFKKVKLFLCSGDIKVGDKVYEDNMLMEIVEGGNGIKDDECTLKYALAINAFKSIGEISPNATWVTEGMEFDEDDLHIGKTTPYIFHKTGQCMGGEVEGWTEWLPEKTKVLIKCPICKQFH